MRALGYLVGRAALIASFLFVGILPSVAQVALEEQFKLKCSGQPIGEADIDLLKRCAYKFERSRDCEGAYTIYQELRKRAGSLRSARKRRSFIAFVATKLRKLEDCYQKCAPTERDKDFIQRIYASREAGQKRRAYRMILRLVRGKNPRCFTWQIVHRWRRELASQLAIKKHQTSVDPCDMDEETKQKLEEYRSQLAAMEEKLQKLQQPFKMPDPPPPPRWAKSGKRYQYWLKRWKRRMKARIKRRAQLAQMNKLHQLLKLYRDISALREKIFEIREEFLNCDQIYSQLKAEDKKLKEKMAQAHKTVISIYESQIAYFRNRMHWFARKYHQLKKQKNFQNTDLTQLTQTLQKQRKLLDSVSKDLLDLSYLLVLKPKSEGENAPLSDTISSLQSLMKDQSKLIETVRARYPQYLSSAEGRQQLKNHLAALERFERILERFQGQYTGEKSEQISETLQAVRGTILLLEKVAVTLPEEEGQVKKLGSTSPHLSITTSARNGGFKNILAWLLLALGLLLSIGAYYYLRRERQFRTLSQNQTFLEDRDE